MTLYLCEICRPVQTSATADRALVAGDEVSGSSPLVGSFGVAYISLLLGTVKGPVIEVAGLIIGTVPSTTMIGVYSHHFLLGEMLCTRILWVIRASCSAARRAGDRFPRCP
jgi:hypothetical protein